MPTAAEAGIRDRDKAFRAFHKSVGMKTFSPEFTDALVATMRRGECLSERIYAWVRWRAWANSSQYAVSDWLGDQQEPLDQIDCIVDLSWFEDGKPLEWITGAPQSERLPARKNAEPLKGQFSRCFARLRDDGRIEFQGRKIFPVVSPSNPKAPSQDAEFSNFRNDQGFIEYWAVADFSNFQARENAKRQLVEAQKLLRQQDRIAEVAYREYLKQATSGERIIMPVKTLGNTTTTTGPTDAPVPEPAAAAAAAEFLPPPEPEPPAAAAEPTLEEVAEVRKALGEFGNPDFKTAELLIVRCRREYRDATPQQIGRKISEVGRGLGPNVRNPIGVLMTGVPASFRGFEPEPDWEKAAQRKVAELEAQLADPELLTVIEAEEISGIASNQLFELIESARLPALDVGLTRPGGRYRVRRSDLKAFQDDRLLPVDRPDPGTV